MSVYLNPSSTLGFHRPLTVLVKRPLVITNPNSQPIAFKVKTTAPKLYCVRPNSGRVEPGESVEVSVMLQALKEEPPTNSKCKDKFLIQSTLLTPEKEALPDIWAASDGSSDVAKVHQQKLKVAYLPPEGQTLEEEEEPQPHQSSMITTNDSQFDTVRQQPSTNGHAAAIPEFNLSTSQEIPPRAVSPPADYSVPIENLDEEIASLPEPVALPPVSVIVNPPEDRTPPIEHTRSLSPAPPNDEVLIKYKEAEAEIERLRALLAAASPPPELRRRSRALSDMDDMTVVPGSDVGTYIEDQVAAPEGVPLQVVVIISLAVFIMTYLFF